MSSQIEIDLGGLLPIGEKRKLLNQFIIKAEENQVNNILENCKNLPSIQYNQLKFLLAQKFHRFDLIIELLYDGDASILSAATSSKWLYEGDNSSFTDSDFLINKLFPNVSYNCRQKVLYRIGRYMQNEEKADKIFNAVEQKYGFHVAFPLLQACSKDKISFLIANRKFDLSGIQMVQILQKHPDIGLQYLKDHGSNMVCSSTNSYRSPLTYLYENQPEEFLDFCINNSDKVNSFKFGRKRSTKMIRTYREKVLEKPVETGSLLKIDRIKREFSADEYQTFFESSFGTKNLDNVDFNDIWKWVGTVPVNKRVDMINRAYMKVFEVNLDEHYEMMSAPYIVWLPDDKRLSAVQWKSENDQSGGWVFKDIYEYCYRPEEKKRSWLPLKPISYSLPEIQKLLLIEQDLANRATLSRYLIETCYINDDLPALLNVLTLLNKRSRNDQADVRIVIFQTLNRIMGKMEFSKEHWDLIIEMIQVSLVIVDSRDYSDGDKEKLVEKCIAFHLTSKLPLNNLLVMHIKLKIKTSSSTWNNTYIKNEADRRILLESYTKALEDLQLNNDLRSHDGHILEAATLSEYIANLIDEICKFNKSAVKQKLDPISIASHQWLRTSFEKIAKEEEDRINKNSTLQNSYHSWSFAKQLVNIVLALRKEQNISLDAFNDSADLFSKILHTSPCSSIFSYYLGKNPSHLIESWPITLSKMLKSESGVKFMRTLKSWNYSALIVPAIKTCSDIIAKPILDQDPEITIQQQCNAVSILSVLSKPTDFLSLAEKFYPTETKLDVFDLSAKDDYQIKQAFAKSLVNVSVSHLTFPAIEKFCVGDYLKLALAALYSHSGRASEQQALNFLRQRLVNSPVSLQKHIIRLYFAISSVEQKICGFREIESSNVSIRYELFLRANRLLRSNPSEETWTILKNIIEKTTEEDAAIILYLHTKPKVNTCPMEYMSKYIITCLALLRRLKPDNVNDFMNLLEIIMDKIPEQTLDNIILHENVDQKTFSSTFCVKYMEGSSAEVADHRLSNICLLLQNIITNGWNVKIPRMYDSNSFDYPTRTSVFEFVSTLCQTEMDVASKAWLKEKIIRTLLEKFKADSVKKFFKEILYLEMGLLAVKEVEKQGIDRLKSFGRNLARFMDSLVETYGGEIVLIVKDAVKDYVQYCFASENNKNMGVVVELVHGMLETSKTRTNQIISINLLQNINPKSSQLVATLEKIRNILTESNDVVAQIYYGSVDC